MANTIVFQRAASMVRERDVFDIFLINDDGTGMVRLTTSPTGNEFDSANAVFSPDGTQLVFETMRNREDEDNENTGEIYRMGRDGGNVTRLTHDNHYDSSPNWSANGATILFAGERPDPKLYTMSSADGSSIAELQVGDGGSEDWSPSYSRDGTRITFIRNLGGGHRAVFVANADGSNAHNLTTRPCSCSSPHWSPDGLKIVYASDHHKPISFELEIYVMDAEDTNGDREGDHRLRLTNDGPSIMSDCPVFSPDGTRIAYSNNSSGRFDIYFVDVSGLNKTLFASYGDNCFVSDWR